MRSHEQKKPHIKGKHFVLTPVFFTPTKIFEKSHAEIISK